MLNRAYNVGELSGVALYKTGKDNAPAVQVIRDFGQFNVGAFSLEVEMETKSCTRCGKERPLDGFSNCTTGKNGKSCVCKICNREYRNKHREKCIRYSRKYYRTHRKEFKEYAKEYKRTHWEQTQANSRKYYLRRSKERKAYLLANREKILAYNRQWYQEHREKERVRSREYVQTHLPEFREYNRQRRARQNVVNESFTVADARKVRSIWNDCCAVCGRTRKQEGQELAIDHWYPLSKGHALTMSNAVLLCLSCNSRKGDKYPLDVFGVVVVKFIEDKLTHS